MTTKERIGKGAEVIAFLLAAFSGFLKGFAPPDETGASFAVGVASFAALLIFLLISALAQRNLDPSRRKYWYLAASLFSVAFLVLAFVYQDARTAHTFLWPPNEEPKTLYVAGSTLTPKAQAAVAKDSSLTAATLVAGFGGIDKDLGVDKRTSVWTADSIRSVGRTLSIEYVVMVLSLAAAIFCLTEGLLLRTTPPPSPNPAPAA
jgi:hypothetical protein